MAEIRGHDWLPPPTSLARIGELGPRRTGFWGADAYCLVSVLSHQRSQATYPLQTTNHDLPASGVLGWPRCSEPINPRVNHRTLLLFNIDVCTTSMWFLFTSFSYSVSQWLYSFPAKDLKSMQAARKHFLKDIISPHGPQLLPKHLYRVFFISVTQWTLRLSAV